MAQPLSHSLQSRNSPPSTGTAELAPAHNGGGKVRSRPAGAHGHMVRFYEDGAVLVAAVADFLAAGLAVGQPLIVIADGPRRDALVRELRSRGIDTARAIQDGRLALPDARDTLATFMHGAMPDGHRFDTVLGGMMDASLTASRQTSVRMYGEMVDLLWKDGNPGAAIRLEELWNGIAASRSFSLLCAYEMSNFSREADAEAFRRICVEHEHVVPTESFTGADDAARMMEISLLQQRARSLEYEIEQRKALESQLLGALAELALTEDEARAASTAKSDFLAVMSHELRTPLNAIGGHIQLIEMGLHGPVTLAQRDALARAQASQRHLLSLINDVLNLVRIESGRLEYAMEQIELRPLLDEVVAMIEPLLRDKRLECELSFKGDGAASGTVYADREKVQQILLNLLTNSIKFTPVGGRIELTADGCDDSGMARIDVRDTGVGIPAAKLEQVFDPFVQAAPRPSGQNDGVGLGLAISRDLARGMGGDLTAASTVGEGTVVTLTLSVAAPGERQAL